MDEYAREIRDLRQELDALIEAEEKPETLRELEEQLAVLGALYGRASELFERGRRDAVLRQALQLRGYGEWTLDNVYAYVYESATDEPAATPGEFLDVIRGLDFGWRLAAPLQA